jgi:hypothetical protein
VGVNLVSEMSGALHIAQAIATMQCNCNVMNKPSLQTFQNQYPYIHMCVRYVNIGIQLYSYVTNENTTTSESLASYAVAGRSCIHTAPIIKTLDTDSIL